MFKIKLNNDFSPEYRIIAENDSAFLEPSIYENGNIMYTLAPTQFIDINYNYTDSVWEKGTDTILVSGEFYVPEGEYEDY